MFQLENSDQSSFYYPPIFDINDPTGNQHNFRLNLKLSGLKCHEKDNFLDTPPDWCDILNLSDNVDVY